MHPSKEVTKEEYQEWLLHPVTRALRDKAREALEERKSEWVNGLYSASPQEDALKRGECAILSWFEGLDEMLEVKED